MGRPGPLFFCRFISASPDAAVEGVFRNRSFGRRLSRGSHLRRGAAASDLAKTVFNSAAQQLAVGIAGIGRDRRVRMHEPIQRCHELVGVLIEMHGVVTQAFELGNVGADDVSAGEPAFHQAAAESFAQRVHPDDAV